MRQTGQHALTMSAHHDRRSSTTCHASTGVEKLHVLQYIPTCTLLQSDASLHMHADVHTVSEGCQQSLHSSTCCLLRHLMTSFKTAQIKPRYLEQSGT